MRHHFIFSSCFFFFSSILFLFACVVVLVLATNQTKACRKRRIKCDEGRPTCNNCLKSKRQCEGYNQRVIFKDPLGAFANAPYGPIHYPAPSPQSLVREQQLSAAQQKSSSQSLQIIAPKPPTFGYHHVNAAQFGHAYPGQTGPLVSPPLNYESHLYGPPQPAQSRYTFFPPETVDGYLHNQWRQEPPLDFNQLPVNPSRDYEGISPKQPLPPPPLHPLSQQQQQQRRQEQLQLQQQQNLYHQRRQQQEEEEASSSQYKGKERADVEQSHASRPQFEEFGYPLYDDDASMGDSDDELVPVMQDSHLGLNEVGLVVSQRLNQTNNFFETQARTFSFFAADNFLATYEPSPMSSPLNDKQIASVFWHFINVTGPSISLYERHPFDPSPLFEGQPVPKSRQHIWTCRLLAILLQNSPWLNIYRSIPRIIFQSPSSSPSYIGSWKPTNCQTSIGSADGISQTLPLSVTTNC